MIAGIQKTTLVDYPGKVACTIFLSGCNFRCGYCHNKDLVLSRIGEGTISEEEVMAFLEKRKHVLDGVCITGGEPTLWRGLIPFIINIKNIGYKVKLDTNGSNPEVLKKIIQEKLVDYIAMDIKASLPSYKRITGTFVNLEKIRQTIGLIKSSGIAHEFRTTVVPDIISSKDIDEIAKLIGQSSHFFIQQFKPTDSTIGKKYAAMQPLPLQTLQIFKDIAQRSTPLTQIRNL